MHVSLFVRLLLQSWLTFLRLELITHFWFWLASCGVSMGSTFSSMHTGQDNIELLTGISLFWFFLASEDIDKNWRLAMEKQPYFQQMKKNPIFQDLERIEIQCFLLLKLIHEFWMIMAINAWFNIEVIQKMVDTAWIHVLKYWLVYQ